MKKITILLIFLSLLSILFLAYKYDSTKKELSLTNSEFDSFAGFKKQAWYNDSWGNCINITVVGGDATLTNFPFYVNVTYNASIMQSDFDDIRFINASCGNNGTLMDYDIDTKTDSVYAGVWVKSPSLATGNNIYSMYVNNSAATSAANPSAVWSDYSFVAHFSEGTGVNIKDSSKYSQNGTANGAWNTTFIGNNIYSNSAIAGFNTTSTLQDIGLSGANTRSVLMWSKIDQSLIGGTYALWAIGTADTNKNFALAITASKYYMKFDGWTDTGVSTDSSVHHTAMTYDGTKALFYLDGVNRFNSTQSQALVLYKATTAKIWDGANWAIGCTGCQADEYRISNQTFSQAYIKRTHESLNMSKFSFGTVENQYNPTVPNNISVNQISPTDFANLTNVTNNFLCNYTTAGSNYLTSVTLNIWYNSNGTLVYNNTEAVNNLTAYNKTWSGVTLSENTFKWACSGIGNLLNATTTNRTFQIALPVPVSMRCRNITVVGGDATLTNFPLYINMSYDPNMNIDFSDVYFQDSYCFNNGANLSFEFDKKINSTYAGVWAKIPTLNTGNNVFSVYYDDGSSNNKEDALNVWSDYSFVAHFSEGTGVNIKDSSKYSQNGTFGGIWNTSIIGNNLYLNSATAGFNTTSVLQNIGINGSQTRSVSIWSKIDQSNISTTAALWAIGTADTNKNFALAINTGTYWLKFDGWVDTGVAVDSSLHYLTVSYDGTRALFYYDGSNVFNSTQSQALVLYKATVGKIWDGANWVVPCLGCQADEYRISNQTFSQAYFKRSKDNLNLSKVIFGTEESQGSFNASLTVVQSQPAEMANLTGNSVNFECNYTVAGNNTINSTLLNVWYNNGSVAYTNLSSANSSITNLNKVWSNINIANGLYKWACSGVGSATNGSTTNRTFQMTSTLIPSCIELNVTGGATNLTDFVFFVKVFANQSSLINNTSWGNVRISNTTCANPNNYMPYEIDYKNTSDAGIWVRAANFATGVNQYSLKILTDKSTASAENAASVWKDYALVYHFSDDITTGKIRDSSPNSLNSTVKSSLGDNASMVSGIFGNQINFFTRDYIEPNGNASGSYLIGDKALPSEFGGANPRSFIFYSNVKSHPNLNRASLITYGTVYEYIDGKLWSISTDPSWLSYNWELQGYSAPPYDWLTGLATTLNVNNYHAMTYNTTSYRWQIDSTIYGSSAINLVTDVNSNLTMGMLYHPEFRATGTYLEHPYNGTMDEVRIINKTFSDNYINRDRANSNFSMFTFGAESYDLTVNINFPIATTYSNNLTYINYTIDDTTGGILDRCIFSNNSFATNYTINCAASQYFFNSSIGSNTWSIWVNNSLGAYSFDTVTFSVAQILPSNLTVILNSPTNNKFTNINSQSFNYTLNIANANITNSTLYLWYSNGSLINSVQYNSSCYQEFANVSTSCGGLNTGSYWGNASNSRFYDGDWSTASTLTSGTSFYINYTIPSSFKSALWNLRVLGAGTLDNSVQLPNSCLNVDNKLQLRVYQNGVTMRMDCFDGSTWANQWTRVTSSFYEENIIWFDMPTNETKTIIQNINNIPEGQLKWNTIGCYSNNTGGSCKWAASNYTLTTDYTNPTININSPTNAAKLNTATVYINYSVSDTNLDSCLWSNNSGISNNSITCGTNISYAAYQGNQTITIYVNDSANNKNQASVNFSVNTQTPGITITSPVNYYNSSSLSPTIQIINTNTFVPYFYTERLNVYNSSSLVFNQNISGFALIAGSRTQSFIATLPRDGTYYYNATVVDDYGNVNNTGTRTLTVDTSKPAVTITSPIGNQGYYIGVGNLSLNYTVSDSTLDSCWFVYDSQTYMLNCSRNTYSFAPVINEYSLTFYANDTFGNTNITNVNWFFSIFEGAQNYTSPVYETSSQNFITTLAWNASIYNSASANFVYDGAVYPATTVSLTGSSAQFSALIDIPLVSSQTSKNFSWQYNVQNSTTTSQFNSLTYNQTVNTIKLQLCNGTDALTINYTIYQELTSNILNATFEQYFNYWLGSGNIYRSLNYTNNLENSSNYKFCFYPADLSLKTIGTASYAKTGYDPREYYFNNFTLTNVSLSIPLYLKETNTTDIVTLAVIDENDKPVSGAYIYVQRWDIGTDNFVTIQTGVTNTNGATIADLVLYSVFYRFVIVYNGQTYLTTETQKMSSTSPNPFRIQLNSGNPYQQFRGVSGRVTYNNNTKTFTYTYASSSNITDRGCIKVYKLTGNSSEAIYSSCVSSASGTLSYTALTNDTYLVQGTTVLNTDGGTEGIIDSITKRIGQSAASLVIGGHGRTAGLLLVGTLAGIGIASGSLFAGLALTGVGTFVVNWLGLIRLEDNIYTLFALLLLIGIAAVRRRNE